LGEFDLGWVYPVQKKRSGRMAGNSTHSQNGFNHQPLSAKRVKRGLNIRRPFFAKRNGPQGKGAMVRTKNTFNNDMGRFNIAFKEKKGLLRGP